MKIISNHEYDELMATQEAYNDLQRKYNQLQGKYDLLRTNPIVENDPRYEEFVGVMYGAFSRFDKSAKTGDDALAVMWAIRNTFIKTLKEEFERAQSARA